LYAAAGKCEDESKRMALSITAIVQGFHTMKLRKRKPFNPMLHETFELATDNFRYVTEKV